MVDVLSQGRLDFGIGRGVLKAEYDLFGIDESESQERYQEALEVIRKTWTQQLMTHVGKHYQFYEIAPHPHPVQHPTPPIWAACAASPESFAWAGAQGFNPMLAPFAFVDRSMLVKLLRIYWKARADAGFDSRPVEVLGVYHLYLGSSDAKAQEIGERHYRRYWKFFAKLNQKAAFNSKAYSRYRGSLDELLLATPYKDLDENDCVMFGSPEHCAERLTRAGEDFGITYPIFEVNFGGLSHEDAMRSIEMLAEQVMPKVVD
jgi:alkanesulfonate monooxygenase SsuD/methylene tetrahydromethanopterin reductase-like flavin-dependent oxidoreductase (luciferase family)